MPSEPLKPFSPPAFLGDLHLYVSPATIMSWILYAVFFIWAIYTIVAIYHWLKYSHASTVAIPAIALHLIVSFSLIAYALTGNIHTL